MEDVILFIALCIFNLVCTLIFPDLQYKEEHTQMRQIVKEIKNTK